MQIRATAASDLRRPACLHSGGKWCHAISQLAQKGDKQACPITSLGHRHRASSQRAATKEEPLRVAREAPNQPKKTQNNVKRPWKKSWPSSRRLNRASNEATPLPRAGLSRPQGEESVDPINDPDPLQPASYSAWSPDGTRESSCPTLRDVLGRAEAFA